MEPTAGPADHHPTGVLSSVFSSLFSVATEPRALALAAYATAPPPAGILSSVFSLLSSHPTHPPPAGVLLSAFSSICAVATEPRALALAAAAAACGYAAGIHVARASAAR